MDTRSWIEIAAGAGDADLSHLCRIPRHLTGFRPQALRHGIEHHEGFLAYRLWM